MIKSVKDFDRLEYCVKCGDEAMRLFRPEAVMFKKFSGFQSETTWNQALGCLVKGDKHLKEICKEKEVIPIGDEPIDSLNKQFDDKRERAKEASYDQAVEGWVGNGD